ncbi:alpha-amylase/4-alpha-glucanotransferase domain-containing protein, partial [Singulisphaera rosea]
AATDPSGGLGDVPASIQGRVVLKQEGLDRLLVYDRYPRKAFVDHFFAPDVTIDDLATCRDVERGDFVTGAYLSKVQRGDDRVSLLMERPGRADGHAIQIRKSVELAAESSDLEIRYVLEGLPVGVPLHFGVEMNFAAMAGHAHDRYYLDGEGTRLGMLDSRLDRSLVEGVGLVDEWLDLSVGLVWSVPGGLWCFPIETVSQSESGFEGVYQSSAVIPHWVVKADDSRRWEVRIRLSADRAHVASNPRHTERSTQLAANE